MSFADVLQPRPRTRWHDATARLGLLDPAEQQNPHSVLIQLETEFTIYLPPRRLD